MLIQNKAAKATKYTIVIIGAIITLIPIFLTILGSLKTLGQLRLDLFGLPNPVMWQNYVDVLDPKRSKFFLSLFNSSVIMIFTVIIDLALSCLAGFALSKLKFLGRELTYNYFLLGLLFPLAVAIFPLYVEIKGMGLLDTYLGVILPQAAFSMPWHIMMARGFFMQIPPELEEAATIDGCGPWRYFLEIVLPLSTPVLTTMAVLTMVSSWNNFFLPLLFLNNEKLYTLPMGVMSFQGQYFYSWQLVLAYIVLAITPAIIFYAFAQKYIISGLTGGAIKG